MPYDRKRAINGALNDISEELAQRRSGIVSFTTARTQGTPAIKHAQNPSGSGGTEGRMAELDPEHQRSEMDPGDTMKQVQSYERRLMGRKPATSDHLREGDETSTMEKHHVEEGDGISDQQTGSIEKQGSEHSVQSHAMKTLDEDSEGGQRDLADKEGEYRGHTGQEHRPIAKNRGGIRHDMGRKIR